MARDNQACAYLEAMAEKVGGDVMVYQNAEWHFIMQRRGRIGAYEPSVRVSMEEPRDIFNEKVRRLMES